MTLVELKSYPKGPGSKPATDLVNPAHVVRVKAHRRYPGFCVVECADGHTYVSKGKPEDVASLLGFKVALLPKKKPTTKRVRPMKK